MVTKEQLLTSSHMSKMLARENRTIKVVLTFAEMKEQLANRKSNSIYTHTSGFGDKEVFFYTDDYCVGVGIPEFKEKGIVPSSTQLYMNVKPRPGVEDGCINSLEKFELVFYKNARRIETIEELVEFLNS